VLVALCHGNIILDRELKQDGSLKIFHFGWIGVDFFFVLSGFTAILILKLSCYFRDLICQGGDETMRIARVLFLKTKPICNPNFHNENCWWLYYLIY
jgi:hypothetical protein